MSVQLHVYNMYNHAVRIDTSTRTASSAIDIGCWRLSVSNFHCFP